MSRANKHGPEPCTCAERAGASWSLTTTSSKSGQYGNVVRRGVVPSVTGWCVGVMAWSPPAKEPSRKSAVGRGGQNRPECSYDDDSRIAWILTGARIRPLNGGGSPGVGGGPGSKSVGGGGSGGSDQCAPDWEGMPLPPFERPKKPAGPRGDDPTGALERLARDPSTRAECVFLEIRNLLVVYDIWLKGKVHLLVMPRALLSGPEALNASHAPLLAHMQALAEWLARSLGQAMPDLAPLRIGFHTVPSMRQVYIHLYSYIYASLYKDR